MCRSVDLGGGAGSAGATLYGLCGLVMWGRTLLFVLVHRELGQVGPEQLWPGATGGCEEAVWLHEWREGGAERQGAEGRVCCPR